VPEIEKFLAPYLNFPIRVLDWGGDTGVNTPFKNSSIEIYDISNTLVMYGKKIDNPLANYDLIVCANVFEHVPYPADLLADIKKIMRPDTVLSIEVPLDEIPYQKKRHWHEHVNFFTPLSLEKLLTRCGLSIINTIQMEVLSYRPYLVACKLEIK
jgi:SAM-dependent methyltransferase